MPKELEKKLLKEAKKRFPKDKEKQNAYVYGTLRKLGWSPSKKKKTRRSSDGEYRGK